MVTGNQAGQMSRGERFQTPYANERRRAAARFGKDLSEISEQ